MLRLSNFCRLTQISITFVLVIILVQHHRSTTTTTRTTFKKHEKKGKGLPGFYTYRLSKDGHINHKLYKEALVKAKKARELAQVETTLTWQLAGPTNIGGRVTDIEMSRFDTMTIYAAAASGGVFKSRNQGKTWQPIFDEQLSLSIGDIAIAPSDDDIIYVGTGEANAGGGSITYDGMGVFKSKNGGKTWQHMGLEESRNVGKIVVDPNDPNRVFVAAMGSLFADNKERGVFRSLDGGTTWTKSLYISPQTGCIDLVIDPMNPEIMYAAMWERTRRPNQQKYGGHKCGIYQSKDGGDSWQILMGGLPSTNLGRIGLAIAPSNPDVLYAIYADETGYFKGVYKTIDGGKRWKRTKDTGLSEIYASYGWWFGKMAVDPNNEEVVYALGLRAYKSINGGDSWKNISDPDVHLDQHGIHIHSLNSSLVVLGNDGGVYVSKDTGDTWCQTYNLPITQFYSCKIDKKNPQNLYGGTQDNGVVGTNTGKADGWSEVLPGDGFQVLLHPTDEESIYAANQYGALYYSFNNGITFEEATKGIGKKDRKNWNTPIVFDPIEENVMYYGTNRLYQSVDAGMNWYPMSEDLTFGASGGNVQYGTITTIAIAPSNNKIIYVGTDDGRVHLSEDRGITWQEIKSTFPKRWVTKITINPTNPAIAYITFSGYRHKEYASHVFQTTNTGKKWTAIANNLPETPINDLLVDPTYQNVLYVATDVGVFFTENTGKSWKMLGGNLPNVPVSDLDFHENTRTLVAATYGRSMYTLQLAIFSAKNN